MEQHSRNNKIAMLALAGLGFVSALWLDWFTLPGGDVAPAPFNVNAFHATISLFFIKEIPVWFALIISLAATAIAFTNLMCITTLSRFFILVLLGLPGLFYLGPVFWVPQEIAVEPGLIVALLSTFATMATVVLLPVSDSIIKQQVSLMERRIAKRMANQHPE